MYIYVQVNQTQRLYFTVSGHIYVSNIMITDEQIQIIKIELTLSK